MYSYKAQKLDGKYKKGIFKGECIEKLEYDLRKNGWYLLGYKKKSDLWNFNKKIKKNTLYMLCRSLAILLKSGINLIQAINLISDKTKNKKLKESLIKINEDILKGESLYSSLKFQQNIYPSLFIEMMFAGEQSGKLVEILNNLAMHYKEEMKLIQKIKKAFIYPFIVFITSICITSFLITNILPEFLQTLKDLGGEIPTYTKIIIFVFQETYNNIFFIIAILIFASIGIRSKLISKTKDCKGVVYKVPYIGNLFRKYELQKIFYYLGFLFLSGIDILSSLEKLQSSLSSTFFKEKILEVLNKLKSGEAISEAFGELNLVDKEKIIMLEVGEEAGDIEEMLLKVADMYLQEIYEKVDKLSIYLEPVMIIIVSFMVGSIVVGLLIPMMNIMDLIAC
ncbi:type IV pilus assembly protein PilC [Clostridium pascui]|uniref:type II secretion system F family protein n=1 Tax=Clostridium pascui TaxID=46609 RepID=UPI00195E9CBA|nr:type II secretion system F family protein [Clostridium pascui]MBM7869275.1 type IV pilus assembly protein PilC [Clostridium pascui]